LVSSLCVCLFCVLFLFNDTTNTEIYTLSLHDALPIWKNIAWIARAPQERRSSASATPSARVIDTGTYSTYSAVLRSEIHTSGSRTIAAKLARPTNGSAGSARLQRCNDRYRANRTGATEKTARWSAEGVRNPHAATVSRSRCGRAASRPAHAASAAASRPKNAPPDA